MLPLYLIGFVAGIVAGISPCILPVLPVVLVAGSTGSDTTRGEAGEGEAGKPSPTRRRHRARPYSVIAGLVLSFGIFTLVGSSLLNALDLPLDFLRDAGLVVLGIVSAGLVFPPLAHLLERPFARFARRQPTGNAGAFALGLGLGVVFVPCAGPVLTAITVVGANHRVGFSAVVLSLDFAAGAALPLLVIALAGERLAARVAFFKSRAGTVRRIGGVVMLAATLAIALDLTNGLQRDVPGYTNALQHAVEGGAYAKKQLGVLSGSSGGSLQACQPGLQVLELCGNAPQFTGITRWLNTPRDGPLSLSSLRGKVVLVDFWTYSCINCQRSIPHVAAWYASYHDDGFEVVGVHTPEFGFEHVVSNVAQAAVQLGVHYPVAVDDSYRTWDAYDNNSWPAEYLIDSEGRVRHEEFGEGDYSTTEQLIRELLVAADPRLVLPAPTEVPDRTPTLPQTPESYLGYDRLDNFAGSTIVPDRTADYAFPAALPPDELALAGNWDVTAEEATAGTQARLELSFTGERVYLVLGGSGTVQVAVDGAQTMTVEVSGIPRLYTLVAGTEHRSATLELGVSKGVEAYDFTFG